MDSRVPGAYKWDPKDSRIRVASNKCPLHATRIIRMHQDGGDCMLQGFLPAAKDGKKSLKTCTWHLPVITVRLFLFIFFFCGSASGK